QPFVDAVTQKRHLVQVAVGAAVQILFTRTEDAAIRAHPVISASVRFDIANDAVGQALFSIDDGKFPVLVAVKAAAEGADPQRAVIRNMQALDKIGRKPVRFLEPAGISIPQTNDTTASRAEPQRPR